jgi:hypothetical protein
VSAATDYIARHGHGVDDEDTSGHRPRHVATDPRDGCPGCRWDECRCLPRLIGFITAPTGCHRCDNGTGPTCAACLGEIAAAERDAEARTVMTSLRGMFDPMTGRPAGGGW